MTETRMDQDVKDHDSARQGPWYWRRLLHLTSCSLRPAESYFLTCKMAVRTSSRRDNTQRKCSSGERWSGCSLCRNRLSESLSQMERGHPGKEAEKGSLGREAREPEAQLLHSPEVPEGGANREGPPSASSTLDKFKGCCQTHPAPTPGAIAP